MCNYVSILSYLLNYHWIDSCPNFCICHQKTTNPGVAWLRDLKKRKFWCKHIILKISKLLRPFTSVEDVSTKYSFQTYEHFNIAFLRGQIWRPDQIFHPIYFHLDLKHTHLDPVCNIRSEYTFNERIYLHIPARLFNILNESEYKFIQMICLCISFLHLNLINTKPIIVSPATTGGSVLFSGQCTF